MTKMPKLLAIVIIIAIVAIFMACLIAHHIRLNADIEKWEEINRLADEGGDENALKIIEMVKNDPSLHYKVVTGAICALGEMHSEAALPFLMKKFGDKEGLMSAAATIAIGKIGTDEAVEFLVSQLSSEDENLFESACRGLMVCPHERVIPSLEEVVRAAKTPDRKKQAEHALEVARSLQVESEDKSNKP